VSQQINLFNPIFLKQKKYFSALTMAQALGLILAGSLAFYSFASYRTNMLGKQAAEFSKRLASEEARYVSASTRLVPRQKSKQVESDVATAEEQLRARRGVMEILQSGKLGNTKGFSEYMRAFSRQIVNGLWLTEFSVDANGNDMMLTGRTLQPELVPTYIRRLSQESVMQGKTFAVLEMHQPGVMPAKLAAQTKANEPARPAAYLEFSLHSREAEAAK
jgi:hypothetical protein